jgi:hypothetical protein
MNWTSPSTAVSTVVGSSHSTRTFRCTHWALFRGPSHPASLVKALALGSPLADASALVAGMTRTTGLVLPFPLANYLPVAPVHEPGCQLVNHVALVQLAQGGRRQDVREVMAEIDVAHDQLAREH